jgi:hypothetical protein
MIRTVKNKECGEESALFFWANASRLFCSTGVRVVVVDQKGQKKWPAVFNRTETSDCSCPESTHHKPGKSRFSVGQLHAFPLPLSNQKHLPSKVILSPKDYLVKEQSTQPKCRITVEYSMPEI